MYSPDWRQYSKGFHTLLLWRRPFADISRYLREDLRGFVFSARLCRLLLATCLEILSNTNFYSTEPCRLQRLNTKPETSSRPIGKVVAITITKISTLTRSERRNSVAWFRLGYTKPSATCSCFFLPRWECQHRRRAMAAP